jgi:3-polyprenyl-4-hydroxybenzoate decarboxylase
MQTDDLRKFLDKLRAEGELEDVRGADPHLEIGTLMGRRCSSTKSKGTPKDSGW